MRSMRRQTYKVTQTISGELRACGEVLPLRHDAGDELTRGSSPATDAVIDYLVGIGSAELVETKAPTRSAHKPDSTE